MLCLKCTRRPTIDTRALLKGLLNFTPSLSLPRLSLSQATSADHQDGMSNNLFQDLRDIAKVSTA